MHSKSRVVVISSGAQGMDLPLLHLCSFGGGGRASHIDLAFQSLLAFILNLLSKCL